MTRPTLILQTTFFDPSDREFSLELGRRLYGLLTRSPDDPLAYGPGVQLSQAIAPRLITPDAADHVVVLPVLGKECFVLQETRKLALETIRRWRDALGPGHVIPIPRAETWLGEPSALPGMDLLTQIFEEQTPSRRVLDELMLATLRLLDPSRGKTGLFVSHAKVDRSATNDAAKNIREYVSDDAIGAAFFNVVDLGGGRSIEELRDGARNGVLVSIRTDSYSSRDWCQKELLLAKQKGMPTLTVEILQHGESLSSAYAGNGPTMLWKDDPEVVVSRAIVECLRAAHFRVDATRTIAGAGLPSDSIPLCRPPELLDLVQGPVSLNRAQVVIYPDPELPASHRQLLATANPRLKLVTPTTAFRRIGEGRSQVENPFDGLQVALSLSNNSPDVDGPEGFSRNHVVDATVYLARSLISAGAHIAYGGDFRQGGFTEILGSLISAYRDTAGGNKILHSYLGAPIRLLDAPGDLAFNAYHMGRPPMRDQSELPDWNEENPAAPAGMYFSDMRRFMVKQTQARVVLAGKTLPKIANVNPEGYGGRFPGVIEEAWRALQVGQPLYVVGGFGGAARIVADLWNASLQIPKVLHDATWREHTEFRERQEAFDSNPHRDKLEDLPRTMEDLAVEVHRLGRERMVDDETSMAWNGLTLDENRRLFKSRDPVDIASLVFKGLHRVFRQQQNNDFAIELVFGSVTAAREIDAIAIGVFDDLPLGGAGAALDQVVAGRATLARAGGRELIGLESPELGADWLYLASLGPFKEYEQLAPRVREAARKTVEQVRRHGFSRLGMVAFGGTMVRDLHESTVALIDGLAKLPKETTVVWFENDEYRFKALQDILRQDERVTVTTRRISDSAKQISTTAEQVIVSVSWVGDQLESKALLPGGTGIAPVTTRNFTKADMREFSKGGPGRVTPNAGQLESMGRDLAHILFGGDANDLLGRCAEAKMTIMHDIRSSQLPFESILAESSQGKFRPATGGGVNRRLAVLGLRRDQLIARPPKIGRLKVLLVVNPLSDLDDADAEGQLVKEVLDDQEHIDLVELRHANATREAVLAHLGESDILHYCGHAFYDGPGEEESGLSLYGVPLFLTDLQAMKWKVRIVFANACESGRVRAKHATTAREAPESASFAEMFLRSGIEAYLGTYWKVKDQTAAEFASCVYASLASGKTLDTAVCEGRSQLDALGKNEWANYVLYGEGNFRLVRV